MSNETMRRKGGDGQLFDSVNNRKSDGRSSDAGQSLTELMKRATDEARNEISEALARELKQKRA